MHFHRPSSTSLISILCWLGSSAEISEGLQFVTTSSTTHKTFPNRSCSRTHSRATPTMLSYTTSAGGHNSVAAAASPATTFLSPRRQNPQHKHNKHHVVTIRKTKTSLDLVGRVPSGGATRSTGLASKTKSKSSSTSLFASASGQSIDCPFTRTMAVFGSVWGSFGVVYILAKAITRVLPIALEPLYATSSLRLSPIQWRYVAFLDGLLAKLLACERDRSFFILVFVNNSYNSYVRSRHFVLSHTQ